MTAGQSVLNEREHASGQVSQDALDAGHLGWCEEKAEARDVG
jgi:hypothetical protein